MIDMQENCPDYSDDYDDNSGCCLNCEDKEDGCLCYNCKCRKCFHYSPPIYGEGDNGSCDLADEYKEEAEEKRSLQQMWSNYYDEKNGKVKKSQSTLGGFISDGDQQP